MKNNTQKIPLPSSIFLAISLKRISQILTSVVETTSRDIYWSMDNVIYANILKKVPCLYQYPLTVSSTKERPGAPWPLPTFTAQCWWTCLVQLLGSLQSVHEYISQIISRRHCCTVLFPKWLSHSLLSSLLWEPWVGDGDIIGLFSIKSSSVSYSLQCEPLWISVLNTILYKNNAFPTKVKNRTNLWLWR